VLVAIIKKQLKLDSSLHTLLQIADALRGTVATSGCRKHQ
jgi:hypothetical protein